MAEGSVESPDFVNAEKIVRIYYTGKAIDIFKERYCLKDELVSQAMWRVARTVGVSEARALEYFHMLLLPNRFIPNTPTWTGAGTRLNQLAACFVLPIEDDMVSIFGTLRDAALIQKSGGGVGFNFGKLRPANALVKSSGGRSSGPVSFLTAYNAVFQTVLQGGSRRGACMGILPVDHPDIMQFIHCKKQEGKITNFNLSISITDDFMNSVLENGTCKLRDPETGEIVNEMPAADLFDEIIESTWTNGEPGVIFIDTINRANPAPEHLKIEATNPCVTEDTVVQCIDGARRVKQLIGVSFRTFEGDVVPGGFFPTRNVTELIKVTTQRGFTIICTPNHMLHTVMGWEKAEDLKAGEDALMMSMGSHVDPSSVYRPVDGEERICSHVGWTLASGLFGLDSEWAEDFCMKQLDTAGVAAAVCILRNCWMFSGRPEGKLVLGNCSEKTAQAMHLCLLRLGLMTLMVFVDKCSWEYEPISRHSIAFQNIICKEQDMIDAISCAVSYVRRVTALSRMERDIVMGVERVTVPGTVVYDATCQDPTNHVLYTDGFLSHNCGEIPLSPYESCCLGSINLRNHVSEAGVNWEALQSTVRLGVRFLNDVIDANGFVPAVPELKEKAHMTRRIGLGIMGLADLLFKMGIRYGSMESISAASQVMEFIRYTSMHESMMLARATKPFPAYSHTSYANDAWVTPARLDTERLFGVPYVECNIGMPALDWPLLHKNISLHGMRNITTTAIAPTGTLSLAAGVSGFGCEPVFGLLHKRRILGRQDGKPRYETMMVPELEGALQDSKVFGSTLREVLDDIKATGSCRDNEKIPQHIRDVFVCASDISVKEHVMMQAALQCFVDGAISKTVNMPAGSTRQDVKETFMTAWRAGCKGICVYIAGSRDTEVLSTLNK